MEEVLGNLGACSLLCDQYGDPGVQPGLVIIPVEAELVQPCDKTGDMRIKVRKLIGLIRTRFDTKLLAQILELFRIQEAFENLLLRTAILKNLQPVCETGRVRLTVEDDPVKSGSEDCSGIPDCSRSPLRPSRRWPCRFQARQPRL